MGARAFLSYREGDHDVARSLTLALRRTGVSVFFAPDSIAGGRSYGDVLAAEVEASDVLVLLVSRLAVGSGQEGIAGSKHVFRELSIADDANVQILPVSLDGAERDCEPRFRYLLAGLHAMDVGMLLGTGQYTAAAARVAAAISDGAAARGFSEGADAQADVLALAEEALFEGRWTRAVAFLERRSPATMRSDSHRLLEIAAELQGEGVGELRPKVARKLCAELRGMVGGDGSLRSLYLLAALSSGFYRARAMHDETGGLAALRAQARTFGRVGARWQRIVEHAFPKGSRFALHWRGQ